MCPVVGGTVRDMAEGENRDLPRILLAGGATLPQVGDSLQRAHFAVTGPVSTVSAWDLFQRRPFDVVVIDLDVAERAGLTLLKLIRSIESRDPRVPVFGVGNDMTLSLAVTAGRAGVTDCHPLDESGLSSLIATLERLSEAAKHPLPYVLLGTSPAITAARERVTSLAELDTPVLISGERGTGHWQVAQYLHGSGRSASSPLRRFDCTIQPESRPAGGPSTWFLEEIHDLTLAAQIAWRDTIRTSQLASTHARVIASTTRDLRILSGRDLFDSALSRDLAQFEIRLPPLRERTDDLPKLVHALLDRTGVRLGRSSVTIAPQAVERLCASAWWENFDELERALESLAAFAPSGEITAADAELLVIDSDPVSRAARERARNERDDLLRLVEECGGNLTRIAERLKVDRGTVRYRLRKHGLQRGG